MRIICLIDSLGSGGAQRQMAYLAVLLKQAGHDVRLLKYHPLDFFEPFVVSKGVRVDTLNGLSPLKRICAVRAYIRNACPDAVIAFLSTPSLLAELSGLPRRRFKIIVSERSLDIRGPTLSTYRRLLFHALAEHVVANSCSQADFICRTAPWLARKTTTILNCVDLDEFSPTKCCDPNTTPENRFLVLASLSKWKNPVALVQALALLAKRRPDLEWSVDWYGSKLLRDRGALPYSAFSETDAAIRGAGFESRFHLHDPSPVAAKLYGGAHAVILPSLFEGCPNVLCEAFACGLPVLASRVGDIPRLVENGVNGFLFDPHSSQDMSRAIERFCDLPREHRVAMGRANRGKAEKLFSFTRFLGEYEALLTA
ncbi:MAG: glycosyltransferase family 4 protein [Verrucomicrobiota bacterium]|nr:glycosyltransferase family 4 protein [Verrucomicrobiota bacterium]